MLKQILKYTIQKFAISNPLDPFTIHMLLGKKSFVRAKAIVHKSRNKNYALVARLRGSLHPAFKFFSPPVQSFLTCDSIASHRIDGRRVGVGNSRPRKETNKV